MGDDAGGEGEQGEADFFGALFEGVGEDFARVFGLAVGGALEGEVAGHGVDELGFEEAVAVLGDGFEGEGADEGLFGEAGGRPIGEEGLELEAEGCGVFDVEGEELLGEEVVEVGVVAGDVFAFLSFGPLGFLAGVAGGLLCLAVRLRLGGGWDDLLDMDLSPAEDWHEGAGQPKGETGKRLREKEK